MAASSHAGEPHSRLLPLLLAGLHRQCLFGGLRIGLYDPVKRFIVGKDHVGDVSLPSKIAAGLLTGAPLASCFAARGSGVPERRTAD